jgi:hypothetical protein
MAKGRPPLVGGSKFDGRCAGCNCKDGKAKLKVEHFGWYHMECYRRLIAQWRVA